MRLAPPQRHWLSGAAAGICFWLSPFVVFVRYQDYSLLQPETGVALAILATIGAVFGLLMESLGQYSRVLVFAFLITLTFDIQLDQATTARLWWIFAGSLVCAWLLRNHLARVGTSILAAMLIVSLVAPKGPSERRAYVAENPSPADRSLPIFLHIILDEQIGVEGIPEPFDPKGQHAAALRDLYLGWGFQVFGRAFSQFHNTRGALPKLFNFDVTNDESYYRRVSKDRLYLTANQYFELMKRRGYRIHVYQSTFLDYCHDPVRDGITRCFTYGLESISSIEGSTMPMLEKLRIVFGVYSRRSRILFDLRVPPSRLSSVSSMGILDELRDDIVRAQPGDMYFVHLMLPHYPYAYRADCEMRDDPWSWLYSYDDQFEPLRNDASSRAERYGHYLAQLTCTNRKINALFEALEAAGMIDAMQILVHGDHGSRIAIRLPTRESGFRISHADYVDNFSTLFAVKRPGLAPAYDRRMLPLGSLFTSFIQTGNIPEGADWAGKRDVFFSGGGTATSRRMPEFGRSLPDYDDNN